MAEDSSPRIDWRSFDPGRLEEILQLAVPPFTEADEAFRQLRYVERYAHDLKCRSVAIESHYIDRDHIEDHSVFYSKSLYPYVNYCRRVHFFSIDESAAQEKLKVLIEVGIQQGCEIFTTECQRFSAEVYLGFAVIKPLKGSPVGRTVLRCFEEMPAEPEKQNVFRRDFRCTRVYRAHLLGVELTVPGLAFQQQDVGVSACATTAIWSALQKTSDHEEIAAATPAQITMLAAKFSLPFGRPMPSEGLSVDQMCQAVQAVGVSPNLFRFENDTVCRAYLYSALKSGFAPVLVLDGPVGRHAVAVVGMKLKVRRDPLSAEELVDDVARDLVGLYIHDDRLGPYLCADLVAKEVELNPETRKPEKLKVPHLIVPLRTESGKELQKESWTVTHILVPMHSKIRLSFSGLQHIAIRAAKTALGYTETFQVPDEDIPNRTIIFEAWIVRAHKYVESLMHIASATADRILKLATTMSMARYLGVVRLSGSYIDPIDVVVDTTSTKRNSHCLGVVGTNNAFEHTAFMVQYLAKVFDCAYVL